LQGGTSYTLPSGSKLPTGINFSPNGLYLATANYNDVTIFSVGAGGILSGATSYALPSGSYAPVTVAFSSDGSYLATSESCISGFHTWRFLSCYG
jgi:WD40 repeat protein